MLQVRKAESMFTYRSTLQTRAVVGYLEPARTVEHLDGDDRPRGVSVACHVRYALSDGNE